jgi:glycosyltransferase involved in cell wall biosynthesis
VRVAYLSPSSSLGGAERCLVDLLAVVRQFEPSWTLHLILPSEGPVVGAARSHGVEVVVLRHDASDVEHCLAGLRPDLVHSNGLKTHELSGLAAPQGVPVLWHLHDYVGSRPVIRGLLRGLRGRSAAAIANASAVAADAARAIGGAFPVRTVPNGIDLDEFSPSGPAVNLDALSGLPPAGPGVVRIGLVATMAFWKGHDVFLGALRELARRVKFRAYVVGGPVYQASGSEVSLEDIRRKIAELGLDREVGLAGFVDRPAAAMRALDVVVHASTRPEPFGLVVAEAMGCGRAVIASRRSGVAEFVRDGDDAILCEASVSDLARVLRMLVADPMLRSRLGAHARVSAVKHFDRQRMGADVMAVYRELARVGR